MSADNLSKPPKVLRSPLFSAHEIPHGFYTREIKAQFWIAEDANQPLSPDEKTRSASDLRFVLEDLHADHLLHPIQVHSDKILHPKEISKEPRQRGTEADAMMIAKPGVAVGVVTADCLPILIADTQSETVAAVHGGWRGLFANISKKTIAAMCNEFQSEPQSLLAAIGPGISLQAYEISYDLMTKFVDRYPWAAYMINTSQNRIRLNLQEIARYQLEEAGLKPANIDTVSGCTFFDETLFDSYRRQGDAAGRQLSAVSCRR